MSDGSGQTAWSYNAVGSVLTERRTIVGVTNTMSYNYNLDGSPASLTYPSGRTVTYTVSNAQRLLSAVDQANGINYATSATYAPPGAPASIVHGYIGSFAGITESYSYNNRLQFNSIQATSSAATALNLAFSYAQPTANNGDITAQTNNVDTGRTQTYTYDNLKRLLTAQAQATSGVDCWGLSFGNGTNAADDPLGNLLNMSLTKCSGPSLSVSVNTSNRITSTGFSYDVAGNNTADGSYTYTYDAENHITSAAGVNYTYDGNGFRVKKSSGTLYWRSIYGDTIAESDLTGSTTNSNYHEYIFFAGRRVARSDPSAASVYYYFVDQLGSTRSVTQSNGTVCFSADYYPYGQELDYNTTCPQNYKFTGYERDPETGLDYAFNRYYNPRLGRFMSADPLAGSIADPQSLNRYTYVRNDPGNLVDPSGLCFMARFGEEYVWRDWILCDFPNSHIIRGGWPGGAPDGGGGGGGGGTPYAGGGSPYRLVLIADCSDAHGRWRDYQVALPNNASGPVPPVTVAESLIPAGDMTATTNWGNNVGDHLRPGLLPPSSANFQQSFFVKTSGGVSRPIAITINGQDYAALSISATNTKQQGIKVLVNGQPAPIQMKDGPCPNNPGDQP